MKKYQTFLLLYDDSGWLVGLIFGFLSYPSEFLLLLLTTINFYSSFWTTISTFLEQKIACEVIDISII